MILTAYHILMGLICFHLVRPQRDIPSNSDARALVCGRPQSLTKPCPEVIKVVARPAYISPPLPIVCIQIV